MNQILVLPDGTQVGTGLQIPVSTASAFPAYEASGPMLSMPEIVDIAKSNTMRGRDRFDTSFIKNQRSHGSCQGFASAARLSGTRCPSGPVA
jgi:hypothetical protein